ncbi:MAG: DNA primase catalytic subunit PriS [Thermoplasmata archaeon]|nr:MAG: DNA primase catalytic subunit PriS [Thermoplasmata archaeon]RLF53595.1 MAG: DNA primase catalytic subunit PriS [Thermoplasmata archaeon]
MDTLSTLQKSLEFLKKNFRKYYMENEIGLPDRFGRREFAFILFSGRGMIRHIGFSKKKQFISFLREKTPAHVYYSSAYYQKPDAPTMQEKKWMGAELIFDLDSDHLPDAEKMDYTQQLDIVKKEFSKLVNDFLLGDFGFDEKYIELYFSGSRGYHCHVKDPRVLQLDSGERREIVDYITGRDLKDSLVFHEYVTGSRIYGSKSYPAGKSLRMPRPDEPGWRGRISRGIIEIINEIKNSRNPMERLKEYGVKQSDAEKLLRDLSEDRIQRIQDGRLDQSKTIRRFFLNSALRKTAVSMSAGETDEPVTCDVKRLIRLPGSLHGKTGFKVVKIKLEELDVFNPLDDAVVLSNDLVKIDLKEKISIKMKDEVFDLKPGEQELPVFLAVFLIGRRIANII